MKKLQRRSSITIWVVCCAIFALAIASRFFHLGADTPYWFPEVHADEGWWADSARGKVLFNNYFADDYGTAYLVTPLYTWTLEAIYRIVGVGLIQTRSLAAISSVLTILAASIIAYHFARMRGAVIAAILLIFSPFFWVHGRVALTEPLQAFYISASFMCWLLWRQTMTGAFLSGAAMAGAIAVKPNAFVFGLGPMMATVAVTYLVDLYLRKKGQLDQKITPYRAGFLFCAGVGTFIGALILWHIIPNWDPFWKMLRSESEVERRGWEYIARLPGMVFLSVESNFRPIMWRPARWSPYIITGACLFLLARVLSFRGKTKGDYLLSNRSEILLLIWVFGTGAAVLATWADRRIVAMMPGMAILAAIYTSRILENADGKKVQTNPRRPGYVYSILLWASLLLPVMIIAKPVVTKLIVSVTHGVVIGNSPGLDYESAASVFMLLWPLLILFFAFFRRTGIVLSSFVVGRASAILLGLLFLYEVILVTGYMLNSSESFLAGQEKIQAAIQPGEVVMGHEAATLLQGTSARVVRRNLKIDRTPFPNPDVWDRLQPRYILETRRKNFHDTRTNYDDIVKQKGYKPILVIEAGTVHNGLARYQFELLELPTTTSVNVESSKQHGFLLEEKAEEYRKPKEPHVVDAKALYSKKR